MLHKFLRGALLQDTCMRNLNSNKNLNSCNQGKKNIRLSKILLLTVRPKKICLTKSYKLARQISRHLCPKCQMQNSSTKTNPPSHPVRKEVPSFLNLLILSVFFQATVKQNRFNVFSSSRFEFEQNKLELGQRQELRKHSR